MTRSLEWAGCVNVRDLGGVPVAGGGETAFGVLVRADNVQRLTDDGWAALVEHGVTRVVDLRWPEERETDPPRDVRIDVVEISLLGELDPDFREDITAYLERGDVAGFRAEQYIAFLQRHREEFGRVFAALAEPAEGTVLFHCFAGKDRTGLIAALALRLAGATVEAAAEDYALSNDNMLELFREWLDGADSEEERRRRHFMVETPYEAMERTLRELGDVEEYLRGAGVTEDQLGRLKERLAAA